MTSQSLTIVPDRWVSGLEIYAVIEIYPRRIGGSTPQFLEGLENLNLPYILVLKSFFIRAAFMALQSFNRSTFNIPDRAGTYWVRAKDQFGKTVTVFVGHVDNVQRGIQVADKQSWLIASCSNYWVDVLLDVPNECTSN